MEAEEFIPEEFMGIPEPESDDNSTELQSPDDPIFEDISEAESPSDDYLPEDAELSLDDELFNPDSDLGVDNSVLDGELEPDEAFDDDLFPELELEDGEADWLTDSPEEEIEEPQFFSEELVEPGPLENGTSNPEPVVATNERPEKMNSPLVQNSPPVELMTLPAIPANRDDASPSSVIQVDNVAKAKLFEYLLNMTKELPSEKAHEAEEKRLPERLETIRKALLDKTPVPPGVRTGIDRRKGPRRSDSQPVVQPAKEEDVFGDTFSMLGKIGKFLPADQKLALRDRMKKIIDVMEKYRH